MFSKCQFLERDNVLIFWGIPDCVPVHLNIFSNYVKQCCPSIRYIFPAKIFPALLLCQKNWFWSKVLLDDFYPFLRSIASSWIHIGVKKFSRPAVCINWKIWKKIVKHNFGMKKKQGTFFWTTLYVLSLTSIGFIFIVLYIVVFIHYIIQFINIQIFWYICHILIIFVPKSPNKSFSNNRFSFTVYWMHFYIIIF